VGGTFARSSIRTFFPTKGVYLSALSSGRINLIDDAALKYEIMNLYEHFSPRLVYSGQIYDNRADQVTWASRLLYDAAAGRLRDVDAVNSPELRAQIDFFADQSRICAQLARDSLVRTDEVIGAYRNDMR